MTISLHRATLSGMISMLETIPTWLDKALAHTDEGALLAARLAPDMHPLPRQIQMASDAAKGAGARLTGTAAPSMPDTETTIVELKARCAATVAYLKSLDLAAVDAGATRAIVLTFPNGGGMKFDGLTFATGFALPNFYFHVGMIYAILRHLGVPLGKFDYLAALAPYSFAPPQPANA